VRIFEEHFSNTYLFIRVKSTKGVCLCPRSRRKRGHMPQGHELPVLNFLMYISKLVISIVCAVGFMVSLFPYW